jgi:hypothetical protein
VLLLLLLGHQQKPCHQLLQVNHADVDVVPHPVLLLLLLNPGTLVGLNPGWVLNRRQVS